MPKHLPELNDLTSHIALYDSEHAYEQLFKYLSPALSRFCYYLLKSHELAEEVASDVMIMLWRKRGTLLEIANIKVYAFVIAKNLSLNLLSKIASKNLSLLMK